MGVNYMNMAYQSARQAIESTYDGKCTIYEYKKMKDPKTKITELKEVAVVKDKSCRVSYNTLSTVVSSNNANDVLQKVKLFIAPEIQIKAGSKIVITQYGVTNAYQKSGEPAIYATHQEINLELYQERA